MDIWEKTRSSQSLTAGDFFKAGFVCLWQDLKAFLRQIRQEAHRDTYGDGCTHPEAKWIRDQNKGRVECGVCGRLTDMFSLKHHGKGKNWTVYWWTPEEWKLPKKIIVERAPIGSPHDYIQRIEVDRSGQARD